MGGGLNFPGEIPETYRSYRLQKSMASSNAAMLASLQSSLAALQGTEQADHQAQAALINALQLALTNQITTEAADHQAQGGLISALQSAVASLQALGSPVAQWISQDFAANESLNLVSTSRPCTVFLAWPALGASALAVWSCLPNATPAGTGLLGGLLSGWSVEKPTGQNARWALKRTGLAVAGVYGFVIAKPV